MKNIYFITLTIILICSSSCMNNKNKKLDWAMDLAGDNSVELKKVLKHYSKDSKDSLKYKAAVFLITKILPFETTLFTKKPKEFVDFENSLNQSIEKSIALNETDYERKIRTRSKIIETGSSLKQIFHHQNNTLRDIKVIKSEFLIQNIDYAFKAWSFPWSKKYSFDVFCKYILPYKTGMKINSNWREYLLSNLKEFISEHQNNTDPIKVCTDLNLYLSNLHFTESPYLKHIPNLLTSQFVLKNRATGNCVSESNFMTEAMRSIGLPVTSVLYNKFGKKAKDHCVNAILNTEGEWKLFNPIFNISRPGTSKVKTDVTKIYTNEIIDLENYNNTEINALKELRLFGWQDNTRKFTESYNISPEVSKNLIENDKAYFLCIFDNTKLSGWLPIDWTIAKDDKIVFHDVGGKDVMYLVMSKNNNKEEFKPVSSPFILDSLGNTKYLTINTLIKNKVELYRKFPPKPYYDRIKKAMAGAKFEASNNLNFKKIKNIVEINENADTEGKLIPVNNQDYKYYRFRYPEFKTNGEYDIAEINFYDKDTVKLNNYIYSSAFNKETLKILTDGDLLSHSRIRLRNNKLVHKIFNKNLETLDLNFKDAWFGVQSKPAQKIKYIQYYHRTDKNDIYPGMVYELFYYNQKWISLGRKIAKKNCLVYDNIPEGALLWLKNYTEGKEERIFTINNGKQIWW